MTNGRTESDPHARLWVVSESNRVGGVRKFRVRPFDALTLTQGDMSKWGTGAEGRNVWRLFSFFDG